MSAEPAYLNEREMSRRLKNLEKGSKSSSQGSGKPGKSTSGSGGGKSHAPGGKSASSGKAGSSKEECKYCSDLHPPIARTHRTSQCKKYRTREEYLAALQKRGIAEGSGGDRSDERGGRRSKESYNNAKKQIRFQAFEEGRKYAKKQARKKSRRKQKRKSSKSAKKKRRHDPPTSSDESSSSDSSSGYSSE